MSAETSRAGHRRGHLVAIGAVVAVLLSAAVVAAVSSAVDETTTVQPEGDVTAVEVNIDAGAITLVTAEELTVTIARRSGRFAGTPDSVTDVTGGRLRVTGSCSPLGIGRCHTPVTIATPPGTTIRASTGAGSIDVEVARGTVEVSTTAGSIALTVTDEVSHLSATTEAGNVDLVVPEAVYAVDAATSLGRTHIEVDTAENAGRVIEAHAAVGNVTIRPIAAADEEP